MLFSFLQKQTDKKKQKKLIVTMIEALWISKEQKKLYFEAIEVLSWQELIDLYQKLTKFVEWIELKEIEQIKKESFSQVTGMRKKEAEEKLEEMNNFSFLLHNL